MLGMSPKHLPVASLPLVIGFKPRSAFAQDFAVIGPHTGGVIPPEPIDMVARGGQGFDLVVVKDTRSPGSLPWGHS